MSLLWCLAFVGCVRSLESRKIAAASEGAPCPVSGDTICDGLLIQFPAFGRNGGRHDSAVTGRMEYTGDGPVALRVPAFSATTAALSPHTSGCVPSRVLPVTGLACPNLIAIRVEFSLLVKWYGLARMRRAEDVAAVSTVVLAHKQVEVAPTLR